MKEIMSPARLNPVGSKTTTLAFTVETANDFKSVRKEIEAHLGMKVSSSFVLNRLLKLDRLIKQYNAISYGQENE